MITVENLSKFYKVKPSHKKFFSGCENRVGVENLTFHIEPGEIVGYIGLNGAGKSTTIKLLTGILQPTDGKVLVDGCIPYRERSRLAAKIGVVFGQRNQLWWDLPLIRSFELLQAIYKIPEEKFLSNLACLKEQLDLERFINIPVRQLSLGQRMRGNLAASLLHDPEILFLDEPTLGLDIIARHDFFQLMKDINRDHNVTIFLTTHNVRDIEELCRRIIVLDRGRKIFDGKITDLKAYFDSNRTLSSDFGLEEFILALNPKKND